MHAELGLRRRSITRTGVLTSAARDADNGDRFLDSDANSQIAISTSLSLPSNPGPGRITVFSPIRGEKLKEISVGQWQSSLVIQAP